MHMFQQPGLEKGGNLRIDKTEPLEFLYSWDLDVNHLKRSQRTKKIEEKKMIKIQDYL